VNFITVRPLEDTEICASCVYNADMKFAFDNHISCLNKLRKIERNASSKFMHFSIEPESGI